MKNLKARLYEQTLILRCQTQDDAAFEEIVRLYEAPLRYFLRRIMGHDSSVDDVLQNVWLDVFRKLSELRSPRAFPVWLYRIARDKAFHTLRRSKRISQLSDHDPDMPFTVQADEQEDFSPDDAVRMHACLEKLSLKHREVLLLRFLEEMTYEDIAHVLTCHVGTVRSRIYYAKLALKKEMWRAHND
ncbi:MAG: sigma-70 family RNA polymerase sigma factor [Phycisphaerae bacterium]|nr:sigma-70 family RNA polymerase sigma factor [Phycisphaerae bacterium]